MGMSKWDKAIRSIEIELELECYNKGHVAGLVGMVSERIVGLCYASNKFRCTSFGDACLAESGRLSEKLVKTLVVHDDYKEFLNYV